MKSKKFKINPIVKKDLRIISRSMKFSWGLFAYEAILGIVFLFVLMFAFESGYGYTRSYETLVSLFPILSAVQFGIITLILPIMTASSISGEKERQTFDLLLTTVMTPRQIIMGKLMSAVIRVMIFIIASIPLMAVSFTLGGLGWGNLFIMLAAAFVFAFFAGAVGMLASTIGKKTLSCIIIAYVIYFAFHQLSSIPSILIGIFAVTGADWIISLLMVFNPVVAVVDMFVLMFQGEGIFDNVGGFMGNFGGWFWVILSGVVIMGVSFIMLEVAARRIDPLRGYAIGKKEKKIMEQARVYAPTPAAGMPVPNAGMNGPDGTAQAAPYAQDGLGQNPWGPIGPENPGAMTAAGSDAGAEPELDFLKEQAAPATAGEAAVIQEAVTPATGDSVTQEPELDFLKEQGVSATEGNTAPEQFASATEPVVSGTEPTDPANGEKKE